MGLKTNPEDRLKCRITIVLFEDIFDPFEKHAKAVQFLYIEALRQRIFDAFFFAEIEITVSPNPKACGYEYENVDIELSQEVVDAKEAKILQIDEDLWQQLLKEVPDGL